MKNAEAHLTDNMVVKAIKEILERGLSDMGVQGFKVLQHSMQTNHSGENVVLFQKISVKRIGFQASEVVGNDDPNLLTEKLKYIEDAYFQISAFRPRLMSDDAGTFTGIDALTALMAWFQSERGVDVCLERGLHPFRITDLNEPVKEDDSSIMQFNPSFDVHFNIGQVRRLDLGAMTDFSGATHLVHEDATLLKHKDKGHGDIPVWGDKPV